MRIASLLLAVASLSPSVTAQTPTITTIAGNGGPGSTGDGGPAILAEIGFPLNLALDGPGNLFFNDYARAQPLRCVDKATGNITSVVGGGSIPYPNDGQLATDILPDGYGVLAVDAAGNLYYTDTADNERIRRVDAATGIVSTIAGGGVPDIIAVPTGIPTEPYVYMPFGSGDGGPATSAFILTTWDMAFDSAGNLYLADPFVVRRIDAVTGTITRVAGNGQLVNQLPGGGIRITGVHSGDGGLATSAGFMAILGLALDGAGNIYVSEEGGSVRRIDAVTGIITTVAGMHGQLGSTGDGGPATAATLDYPVGLAVDAAGHLYIADYNGAVIRRVDAVSGVITTVAGNGTYGFSGDGGPAVAAQFGGPYEIAFDPEGNLYVTDLDNSRIRKITGLNPNAPPTANAGPDQAIHASGMVFLDGDGSFDDNTPTASLNYLWTLVERPAGSLATLSDANTAYPSFVADEPGTYVVELVVTDGGSLASTVDEVVISSTNLEPTANAGIDQGGVVNDLVTLDGAASSDPDLDPLTFFWTFSQVPEGSAATLAGSLTSHPSFTPDLAGTYVLALVVDDGFGPSLVDEVVITVITGQQFAENSAVAAMNETASLPAGSVSSNGNQQALVQFLSQAVRGLQSNNLAEARLKLQMAISRTDGYPLRGARDQTGPGRDWIMDSAAQNSLYGQLTAALHALAP